MWLKIYWFCYVCLLCFIAVNSILDLLGKSKRAKNFNLTLMRIHTSFLWRDRWRRLRPVRDWVQWYLYIYDTRWSVLPWGRPTNPLPIKDKLDRRLERLCSQSIRIFTTGLLLWSGPVPDLAMDPGRIVLTDDNCIAIERRIYHMDAMGDTVEIWIPAGASEHAVTKAALMEKHK